MIVRKVEFGVNHRGIGRTTNTIGLELPADNVAMGKSHGRKHHPESALHSE